jgi:hypothetical protein
MNKSIHSYSDLVLEKERLQALLDAQKDLIKLDIEGLKNGLKPATTAISFMGNFTKKTKSNPLLGMAVSLSTDLLMRKFFLKKAGWAVKTVMPFVIKRVTNKIVANPAARQGLLAKLVRKIV